MAKVVIDQNKCKGCGLCTTACPKKILTLSKEKINAKGYNPCEVIDIESCIGCAFCATMCPDVAIRVER